MEKNPTMAKVLGKHITIQTYGYEFGPIGKGYRFNADVRNILAGNFGQDQTGLEPEVSKAVMKTKAAQEWLHTMEDVWTPKLKDGDKVSIGCSRGHHRSVALAEAYAKFLRDKGFEVTVKNRDINKNYE